MCLSWKYSNATKTRVYFIFPYAISHQLTYLPVTTTCYMFQITTFLLHPKINKCFGVIIWVDLCVESLLLRYFFLFLITYTMIFFSKMLLLTFWTNHMSACINKMDSDTILYMQIRQFTFQWIFCGYAQKKFKKENTFIRCRKFCFVYPLGWILIQKNSLSYVL